MKSTSHESEGSTRYSAVDNMNATTNTLYDIAPIMGGLYGDGIIACKGAFERGWVQQLHEDVTRLYAEALKRPGGAVGRGPKRHYVEIHPESIRGFAELAMHPCNRCL